MSNRFANDTYEIEVEFVFPHDKGSAPSLTAGVAATGLITCVANASMLDTDYVTINDGFRSVIYEYDKASDGVTAGRVAWAVAGGAAGAIEAAGTLKTAIEANQPALTVTDNADGTLTITHRFPGTGGNNTITENVADAGFLVTGLAAGAEPVFAANQNHAATESFKLFTVPAGRKFKLDQAEYINDTGLAGHASNYWEIALKADATVMAQWSTDSDVAGQGTLSAATPVDLVLSATAANRTAAAAAVVSLALTKVASAADLPPGRVRIRGRYV